MSKQLAVERAARAAAEFGDAAGVVDAAAADVFGVNPTDLRILGAVLDGPLTAGQVAAAVHLSPAAATTAIQRLVARGHLTREPDPEDRRRAVVALTPSARELAERIYGPVGEAGVAEMQRWSAAELELIADFLERGRAVQLAQAARIRALVADREPPLDEPG
ncbi:MarR family winged helix-turn-helix transcriptional regulator [Pseudonocardia cypriaca]|uniref:DNA-binding MarR family transcriptional regulator n=1 Tax=Pseudonocardia cypriaca TaxID=882449 RepID=A0A543FVR6_9PSEU|nr:MarR family transcriptional regulator [Pseudonocardia cypriaca]TQM37935.1 DNA-binding MarR family transcriptional regulator [Pseudonocardia cypriaca]